MVEARLSPTKKREHSEQDHRQIEEKYEKRLVLRMLFFQFSKDNGFSFWKWSLTSNYYELEICLCQPNNQI